MKKIPENKGDIRILMFEEVAKIIDNKEPEQTYERIVKNIKVLLEVYNAI